MSSRLHVAAASVARSRKTTLPRWNLEREPRRMGSSREKRTRHSRTLDIYKHIDYWVPGWVLTHPGWGLLSQFPLFCYFPIICTYQCNSKVITGPLTKSEISSTVKLAYSAARKLLWFSSVSFIVDCMKDQRAVSISDKTFYHTISWSLETGRLVVWIIAPQHCCPEVPVKFQSDRVILNVNLASRLCDILR